ncbi:MAG TPA: hypothetical protein VGI81_14000 [Tepidisphaeraceae bacterium]|jgi:hypothetical protein
MFLPVLLVRDLGLWGWIVFAVPNVVGAAAMGWVLSEPGRSERMVREHRAACGAFSAITIAFHVFFLLWFVPRLVGLPFAALAFALVAIYLPLTVTRDKLDLPTAVIVWAFSLAMFALFLGRLGHVSVPLVGREPTIGAAWLAPVCVFGFIFCPYLDLTFHRARQAVDPAGSRIAFGVGFGVCFFAMIVFSLLYATTLIPLLTPEWRDHLRPALGGIIAAHMIVQAAFTLSVHTRSFVATATRRGPVLMVVIVAQLALFVGLGANLLPRYHGLDAGEVIYRLFMAFYGLVFPAYVWLCIVPGRDGSAGVTPAKARALVLGILVAAPMFWMGFIENRMAWLIPGLLAVLLSRFMVPRRVFPPLTPGEGRGEGMSERTSDKQGESLAIPPHPSPLPGGEGGRHG